MRTLRKRSYKHVEGIDKKVYLDELPRILLDYDDTIQSIGKIKKHFSLNAVIEYISTETTVTNKKNKFK